MHIFESRAQLKRRQIFTQSHSLINHSYAGFHDIPAGENPISKTGFPDDGNSLYSNILSLNDWIQLHKALGAHSDIPDNSIFTMMLSIVTMISLPKTAAVLSICEFLLQCYDTVMWGRHGANKAAISRENINNIFALLSTTAALSALNVICKGKLFMYALKPKEWITTGYSKIRMHRK